MHSSLKASMLLLVLLGALRWSKLHEILQVNRIALAFAGSYAETSPSVAKPSRLENILSSDSGGCASVLFWQAQYACKIGRSDVAETLLKRLVNVGARSPLASAMLGQTLLSRGDRQSAVTELRKCKGSSVYFYNQGRFLLGRGQTETGADAFRISIAIDPRNADAYRWLGSSLWSLPEKADEMTAAFRKYLELEGTPQLERFVVIGQLSTAEGRWKEAESAWRQVTALSPDNSYAHLFLGWALSKQERCSEALPSLEKAWSLHPEKWSLLYQARCRRALRQGSKAEEIYVRILEKEPGWALAKDELEDLRRERQKINYE